MEEDAALAVIMEDVVVSRSLNILDAVQHVGRGAMEDVAVQIGRNVVSHHMHGRIAHLHGNATCAFGVTDGDGGIEILVAVLLIETVADIDDGIGAVAGIELLAEIFTVGQRAADKGVAAVGAIDGIDSIHISGGAAGAVGDLGAVIKGDGTAEPRQVLAVHRQIMGHQPRQVVGHRLGAGHLVEKGRVMNIGIGDDDVAGSLNHHLQIAADLGAGDAGAGQDGDIIAVGQNQVAAAIADDLGQGRGLIGIDHRRRGCAGVILQEGHDVAALTADDRQDVGVGAVVSLEGGGAAAGGVVEMDDQIAAAVGRDAGKAVL